MAANKCESKILNVTAQVYERIKAPLLTLVNSGSAEQTYAVLSHLHLLVLRAPALFSNDYKHFYCRYSDPSYVKKLKLEMLTAVANETNTYEIGKCDDSGFGGEENLDLDICIAPHMSSRPLFILGLLVLEHSNRLF